MARIAAKLFWIATGLISATGLLLFGMKYLMTGEDPYSAIHHPLQPWMLKSHILVGPLFIFALGGIAVTHIWPQLIFRARPGRRSGMSMTYLVIPLVMSGFVIQILTHEEALTVVRWLHIGVGAIFLIASLAHRYVAQRHRAAVESSEGAPCI